MADCDSEKILKKLVGKADVEDAVSRLDMLTKEESLMMMMRNLEVTHRVDGIVHDVDGNVKATKVITEDIDDNVKATKVIIEDIDDNVKATKVITEDIDDDVKATKVHIHDLDSNMNATKVLIEDIDDNVKGVASSIDNGTHHFLPVFIYRLRPFPRCVST